MTESLGLAKSAESVQVKAVEHSANPLNTSSSGELSYLGVPVDIYGYFGLDLNKASNSQREKMLQINRYVSDGDATIGDRMMKIRQIERKLGMGGMDSRIDKIYRYIRLSENIRDLEARRKALEVSGGNW